MAERNKVLFFALIISALSLLIWLWSPYIGDDWVFKGQFQGPVEYDSNWFLFPKWAVGFWISTNGRFFNILQPIFMAAPKWIPALISATALFITILFTFKFAKIGKNQGLLAMCVVAICSLTLPWWDSTALISVQFNYLWACAISLIGVYLALKDTSNFSCAKTIILFIVTWISGQAHEAAGLSLSCGIVAFYFLNRTHHKFGGLGLLSVAFVLGSLFVFASPAKWGRVGACADDPLFFLLLKSTPLVYLLTCVLIGMMFSRKGRAYLKCLLHTPIVIFIVAAYVSTVICSVGGIVGRPGWFSEVYATIALAYMASTLRWKSHKSSSKALPYLRLALSVVIGIFILTHYIVSIVWQYRAYQEYDAFEKAYAASADGVVFMDYLTFNDLPWITLNRVRGVPDPDDAWDLLCYKRYHRPNTGDIPLIIPVHRSEDQYITTQRPEGITEHYEEVFLFDDGQRVARPFTEDSIQYWYVSRRVINPGDRF